MKHYIKVRIKTSNKSNILLKLNRININIKNIEYIEDYLVFDILASDIKRVKKYLISEKIEIIDETGIYKVKKSLKKNISFIISIIFGFCIFYIFTNIIIEVNIIHSDSKIRELLKDALEERGITPLTFKKSYDEYEQILEDIKSTYKDKIEWMEIDVDGMIINVRVEERIENEVEKDYQTCHIIASKSGIVKRILTERGVTLTKINDFVEKGDILISGEIKMNEIVKNNVCASGEIVAEVWYQVTASMPLNYEEKEDTGKMRYNFMLSKNKEEYVILKSRVGENKRVEKKVLFKLFGFEFSFLKEYEVKITKKVYTEEEGLEELKNKIHEKITVNNAKTNPIIYEKYLKKSVNNGNLDIGMFIAIEEQIGVVEYYNVETDRGTDDEKYNGNSDSIN